MGLSILITSCGKSAIDGVAPGVTSSSSASLLQVTSQQNFIKSTLSCSFGRHRLNDANFYINSGSMNSAIIGGDWHVGTISNGIISDLFVGASVFHDLLFLTKATRDGQVVGYNVTLSYCETKRISNDWPLINFQAPDGIMLNVNKTCSFGGVIAIANTVITQRNTTPTSTLDSPIYTMFASPSCN